MSEEPFAGVRPNALLAGCQLDTASKHHFAARRAVQTHPSRQEWRQLFERVVPKVEPFCNAEITEPIATAAVKIRDNLVLLRHPSPLGHFGREGTPPRYSPPSSPGWTVTVPTASPFESSISAGSSPLDSAVTPAPLSVVTVVSPLEFTSIWTDGPSSSSTLTTGTLRSSARPRPASTATPFFIEIYLEIRTTIATDERSHGFRHCQTA